MIQINFFELFFCKKITKGWDGRANGGKDVAQIDVYVWKVNTKDFSGNNHHYVGTVTIVK